MILVMGFIGFGKMVLLYIGLNIFNIVEINIFIVEDFVEINFEGINQVNVNNCVGLGFVEVLWVFLCQDLDVIMVGEIWDFEIVNIVIKVV